MWIIQNLTASGEKPLNIMMSQELWNNCLVLFDEPTIQDEVFKVVDIIVDAKWTTFDQEEKFKVQNAVGKAIRVTFSDPLLLQLFLKTMPDLFFLGKVDSAKGVFEMLVQTLKTSSYDCDLTYFLAKTLTLLCGSKEEYMSYFAEYAMQLELSLSGLVNQAAVEPKLFPAMEDLMRLVSLFYKSGYKDNEWVQRYRQANLMPGHFKITKFFEFPQFSPSVVC